jgi:hypothetical protein
MRDVDAFGTGAGDVGQRGRSDNDDDTDASYAAVFRRTEAGS